MSDFHPLINMDTIMNLARRLTGCAESQIEAQTSSTSSSLGSDLEYIDESHEMPSSSQSMEVDDLFQASQITDMTQNSFMVIPPHSSDSATSTIVDDEQQVVVEEVDFERDPEDEILNQPTRSSPGHRRARIGAFERYLSMPFRTDRDYLNVARIVRVLQIILTAQMDGIVRQIRGVYYDDVPLFKTPHVVTNIIQEMEDYFGVPSSRFNLMPGNKGLFAGPVSYSLRNEDLCSYEYISGTSDDGGVIIARDDSLGRWSNNNNRERNAGSYTWGVLWMDDTTMNGDETFIYKEEIIIDTFRIKDIGTKDGIASIKWVVIIEKDTVFTDRVQKLNRSMVQDSPDLQRYGHGILVTGKGMPDMATRRWLELLARDLPESVRFYAFMDGDAYGMHICHTYRTSIRHYSGYQRMADRLQWIGLKPSETLSVLQKRSPSGTKNARECGAILLELTERNRAMYLIGNDTVEKEMKTESLRLMMYGYKLELEAVASESLFSFMPSLISDRDGGDSDDSSTVVGR